MFCTYGANVDSLKLVVEIMQCVWISGNPNNQNIGIAKWIDFETPQL